MKKNISLLLICLVPILTFAQQSLWSGQPVVSPEIHPDNTVTFRYFAPEAKQVMISGDWMPAKGWEHEAAAMIREENGLWSYTTGVLHGELYSYHFLVDGIRCTDPNNVYLIRDVATLMNIFLIGGGTSDLYKVNSVPHGTVTRRWYESPELGKSRRMTIYTPSGYESSREKYPVLYLLHGMGGDEEAWITLGRTAQILDNLIAQGKARPMIVVMPNGNVVQEAAPGESSLGLYKPTFELPNTMDGKYEESFQDIIRFVESNYRVISNKSGRAIAGLSMGGFHSCHISRFYPNTFDYVGLFSPAINPIGTPDSKVYQNLDETLLQQKQNGLKLYWIAIGKTDFLYKDVETFRAKLDGIRMPYTYRESEGGHTWDNWRIYLSEFVPMLFR